MADDILVEVELSKRSARPSLTQLRAIIDFMEKHPELANKKLRNGMTQKKVRKLWTQLTNNANSMDGASKSMEGWMKFWADKTRSIKLKQKQIKEDNSSDTLTPLEQRVLDLFCGEKTTSKRKKGVKQEPCNGNDDDDSMDSMFHNEDMDFSHNDANNRITETEEQQINLMEKLVEVMNQQATAMSQIAQSSLNNALALQRLADASHMQALAVERLANSFGTINSSMNDVRNAIVSIDYTMKRCYSASTTQHRQNSNLFS